MADKENHSPEKAAVILAAGKGTRMKSELPKVAAPLAGKAMLLHVIESLIEAGLRRIVVVVGYKKETVMDLIPSLPGVSIDFAEQAEQKGTAHALLCTEETFKGFEGEILVACGDMPLIRSTTFEDLITYHKSQKNSATVLSALLEDPAGYGRIVRNGNGNLKQIIEEKDAPDEIKKIKETNTGTYIFSAPAIFSVLKEIGSQNAQNEFYLPDAISLFKNRGNNVGALVLEDSYEAMGANSREDLQVLEGKYAERTSRPPSA